MGNKCGVYVDTKGAVRNADWLTPEKLMKKAGSKINAVMLPDRLPSNSSSLYL